ncbi:hypothetical protein [Streptomyces sp. SID2888]|uniref:hypothetical protein n=1 Tax=Streptomyces sp. SID2888 TaxID=2690256 RepID=UPI00136F4ECB|nr:hypothetical protein [Streptomyces sp. SID2888]MYV44729.1 hypothetical protein [Streptomyces sp. SID2888]
MIYALAAVVFGSAVAGAMLGGPWMLVWFLPAMLGSLVAIWCVRHGIRLGRATVTVATVKDEPGSAVAEQE